MKFSTNRMLVVIALTVLSFDVTAHNGATGIVKDRMDAMSDMGDAMKIMADMMKGKRSFEIEIVRDSADSLATHSRGLVAYFPDTEASRMSKESDALPKIWTSWDQFQELSIDLEITVDALKQASEKDLDKRAFRRVFSKTAKACSACHDDFRRPKE